MDRAQRILKAVDDFLEEHRYITIHQWNKIILEVETENFKKRILPNLKPR